MPTTRHTRFFWLLATTVSAAIIQSRYNPQYAGIQFASDRKLSITVFSDLHFGERKLSRLTYVQHQHSLTACS